MISTGKYEKKGIKSRDLSKISTSFHLSKSLNLLKFLDKLEQVMCEIFAN